jgi:SOUL heme-binding protein
MRIIGLLAVLVWGSPAMASAYLLAETRVEAEFLEAGNVAFNRLFRYISGNNESQQKIAMTAPVTQSAGEKIAMTAPVTQSAEGGSFLVGFVVPSLYSKDTVPRPRDPKVYIREVPAQLVATWRYSGRWTESNFREAEQALRAALAERGLTAIGDASIARYDPPFMPTFLRRNEVFIPVRRTLN